MMKTLTHILFPLLVFPLLSFTAVYLILYQSLLKNGLQSNISAICEPGLDSHPYRLPYTNNTDVDKVLCGMVVFFHALIDPAYNPLLAVFFPAVGVVAFVPFLEAARDRLPFVLRMPTLIGVVFQLATMGAVIPLYALLFVMTQTASILPSASSSARINQGNAEALLFGFLLGFVLPTTLMIFFVYPYVTAVWQGFPLLFALAVFAHKLIRPPWRHVQSGYLTVVAALVFIFALSALLHAIYVWPILTDVAMLRTMFLPVVEVSDPTATTLVDGVIQFIKWDIILALGSLELATFWMADSWLSLVGILAWHAIANIALGPAAATVGVFLWRERRLNGRSQAEKAPKKMD